MMHLDLIVSSADVIVEVFFYYCFLLFYSTINSGE